MILNRFYETLTREELEQLQIERLQSTLNRVYRNVAFYRQAFDAPGRGPGEDQEPGRPGAAAVHHPGGPAAGATPTTCSPCRCATSCASTPPPGPRASPSWWATPRTTCATGRSAPRACCAAAGVDEHDVVQIAFPYNLFTGRLRLPPGGRADRRLGHPRLQRQHRGAAHDHARLQDHRADLHPGLRRAHRRHPGRRRAAPREPAPAGGAVRRGALERAACAPSWRRACTSSPWTTTA